MDDELRCPTCAGPIDPATGECIEHRELWEAFAQRMAEVLDRVDAAQPVAD